MSEDRRVSELETAHIKYANDLVALGNDYKNTKEEVSRLRHKIHQLTREMVTDRREMVDFALRLDALEAKPRFSLHSIWSRLFGWSGAK